MILEYVGNWFFIFQGLTTELTGFYVAQRRKNPVQ